LISTWTLDAEVPVIRSLRQDPDRADDASEEEAIENW
jgi:hypothetical protein